MSSQRTLIVDDEPDIRALLEITLIRMGIDTRSAENVADAKKWLAEETFDLVLTDMNLPDGNGIDLVKHIQSQYKHIPVAMITAYGSVDKAILALKAGAFDFLSKPVDLSQLRELVSSALKLSANQDKQQNKTDAAKHDDAPTETLLSGKSETVKKLNKQIAKLSRSQAPIFITGESGCGKELVARSIHKLSHRNDAPFIAVNCGAIPSELMESELFGHKKGSFSGAHEDKQGLFRAAQGGTLFLDEVADLPLAMQVKLLRVIQEKTVRAVGSEVEDAIDVRLLSATHKNLSELVDQGEFRQDLFFRINVIGLNVPALRSHPEDIPDLAKRFLKEIAGEQSNALITQDAMTALENYHFPGNVRELGNIIERAYALSDAGHITTAELDLSVQSAEPPASSSALPQSSAAIPRQEHDQTDFHPARRAGESLESYLENIEKQEIEKVLQALKWNRTAAAKELGMTFRSMRYKLKKLGLD